MKYIILPILKFIWALILSILYTVFVLWIQLIVDGDIKYTFKDCEWDCSIHLSSYWSTNSRYYTNQNYFFKSYYHYIWNIK